MAGRSSDDEHRAEQIELEVDDPSLAGAGKATGASAGERPHGEERLVPGGVESAQNVDARNAGECGDGVGAQAVLLVTHADSVRLQDSPMDAVGTAQVQRIDTAHDRASQEDRRATPHPAYDPFLASGNGAHPERRDVARVDPRDGARSAPHATQAGERNQGAREERGGVAGSEPNTLPPDLDGAHADRGSRAGEAGRSSASPGQGIQNGERERESAAARVATGRPPVDEGPAATLTEQRDSRVRDDARSELLATRPDESWVEASEHGGAHTGRGVGGVGGGGAAGSGGGRGEGGHARAYGPGGGDYDALDTSDARYQRWFLDQSARVERHLVFPRERMLAMDQGISVYRVLVNRDGTVRGVPELIHSSGFDDLDRAALVALLQSFPFGPVPDAVMGTHATLRLVMPIKFSNPMVH